MAKLQKVADKAALEEVEVVTAEKDEIVEDVEPHTRATSAQRGENMPKVWRSKPLQQPMQKANPKVNEMVTQDSSEDECGLPIHREHLYRRHLSMVLCFEGKWKQIKDETR